MSSCKKYTIFRAGIEDGPSSYKNDANIQGKILLTLVTVCTELKKTHNIYKLAKEAEITILSARDTTRPGLQAVGSWVMT